MDVFCKIINGDIPSKKIYEDESVVVILDVNPRSNGHCLVIPKKHYQDIFDIDEKSLNHIFMVARDIAKKIYDTLNCDGITLEENNGSCQEVKHFHLHIIPRYKNEAKNNIDEIFEKLKEEKN